MIHEHHDKQFTKQLRKQARKDKLEADRDAIYSREKPDRPGLRKAGRIALAVALPLTAGATLSTMGHNKAPVAPKAGHTAPVPTYIYDTQNHVAGFSITHPTSANKEKPVYEVTINNNGYLSEAATAIASAEGLPEDVITSGFEDSLDNDITTQLDPSIGYTAIDPGTTVYLYPESPIVNPKAIDQANEQGDITIKKIA